MIYKEIGILSVSLRRAHVTYGEYIHHYPTKKEPLKFAWEAAIFTFTVFMLLILGAGFFISHFIQ